MSIYNLSSWDCYKIWRKLLRNVVAKFPCTLPVLVYYSEFFSTRKITDNRQRRMSSTLQAIAFACQLNYGTKFDKYFRRKFSHFHILHSYSEMLHASPRRYPNGKCTSILNQRGAIHTDVGDCLSWVEGSVLKIHFMRDFRLPLWCRWDLRSSGLLRSV
jgi:hypothetical protein